MSAPTSPKSLGPNNLLRNFTAANRNLFPVLSRVIRLDEVSTILENHRIDSGTQLVLHGWTRQSKVMATSSRRFFAIPMSYQGEFRLKRRVFHGLLELVADKHTGLRMRVVEVAPGQKLPVRPGDVITLTRDGERSFVESNSGGPSFVSFEKYDVASGRASEIFLSLSTKITLEEVVDGFDSGKDVFTIRELVDSLGNKPIDVVLFRPCCDQPQRDMDLPMDSVIRLVEVVAEPAVYASIQLPENPTFHIPIRTPVYVR